MSIVIFSYCKFLPGYLFPVAVLVFFPTAARTRIIPAYLVSHPDRLCFYFGLHRHASTRGGGPGSCAGRPMLGTFRPETAGSGPGCMLEIGRPCCRERVWK